MCFKCLRMLTLVKPVWTQHSRLNWKPIMFEPQEPLIVNLNQVFLLNTVLQFISFHMNWELFNHIEFSASHIMWEKLLFYTKYSFGWRNMLLWKAHKHDARQNLCYYHAFHWFNVYTLILFLFQDKKISAKWRRSWIQEGQASGILWWRFRGNGRICNFLALITHQFLDILFLKLQKTRQTLNEKIGQLNSAIDNVSTRLRGGNNLPQVPDESLETDAEEAAL